MHKIKGLLLMLTGLALVVAGIALNVAWLAFCFGTVIIGIILLLFFTPILFVPYFMVANIGWRFLNQGLLIYKRVIA
jgi:hypothetical protein